MARGQEQRSAGPARIRRSELSTPPEFSGDPIIWAAWLYYEERMTQEEVAEQLGVSRASVVNFLQEARDRNIVTIAVASDHLQSVRIARTLSGRYGLSSCVVVPEDGGRMPNYERVGRAGGRLLAEILEPDDVLGVSWGRTVLSLSASLAEARMPGVTVVQIAGSAIGTAEFSPELCTSNIAYRIGARCVNLHAPGIVSKPEVKKLIMQEPSLVEQFKLIRTCTKVLFGVTGLDSASMALRSGYMTAEKMRPYVKGGAIAVMSGRFLNAEGRPVLGPLDEQMIGLTIPEIARIPQRICVAAGPEKIAAIKAMLRGGYATILVTDEPTAQALVATE
jgi:DNA-binding transcriptional regulator LsrR (DeoR family)